MVKRVGRRTTDRVRVTGVGSCWLPVDASVPAWEYLPDAYRWVPARCLCWVRWVPGIVWHPVYGNAWMKALGSSIASDGDTGMPTLLQSPCQVPLRGQSGMWTEQQQTRPATVRAASCPAPADGAQLHCSSPCPSGAHSDPCSCALHPRLGPKPTARAASRSSTR